MRTPERCPTCGRNAICWSRPAIIAACQRWVAEHGGPPRVIDWQSATPDYPQQKTVKEMFGSWNAMISAAGFEPRPRGGRIGSGVNGPVAWWRENFTDAEIRALAGDAFA